MSFRVQKFCSHRTSLAEAIIELSDVNHLSTTQPSLSEIGYTADSPSLMPAGIDRWTLRLTMRQTHHSDIVNILIQIPFALRPRSPVSRVFERAVGFDPKKSPWSVTSEGQRTGHPLRNQIKR